MKLENTPTIEKINLDYNYIVPIFKGVRNYKALKDLADLMRLDIEINGESVYDKIYENGIAEECVDFIRINDFGWLGYIYFNYDKNGECVSIYFDVWSNDIDSWFLEDVEIENLEDEYADGIKWIEMIIKGE